jgi:tRNA G18 (ribose-2'-O)-methylase SpoU
MKLNAQQLRDQAKDDTTGQINQVERNNIYLLVENVYDTYNVGGLFRLADALAVKKLYLIGDTETPPNGRILKASIGTYKVVPWVYKKTSAEAIEEIRNEEKEVKVYAVEQDDTSIDYRKAEFSGTVALMVGNETFGIIPETLKIVDKVLEIPMWGVNKSLNVIVSAAIVSYFALESITS